MRKMKVANWRLLELISKPIDAWKSMTKRGGRQYGKLTPSLLLVQLAGM